MNPENLTSFDLYTKLPIGQVFDVASLRDNSSAMYPCYYMQDGDHLKVSTSVVSLIQSAGTFQPNPRFSPPRFPLHSWQRNAAKLRRSLVDRANALLNTLKLGRSGAIQALKARIPTEAKTFIWNPHQSSYDTGEVIDLRISRLKAFESIDRSGSTYQFDPDYSITDVQDFIEESARCLARAVNRVESENPGKVHIVLTGGKDSQLINLIPKLDNEKWYIFSAEPNFQLVKDWVNANALPVVDVIRHDGENEETMADFKRKILCGDLYSSPVHIRYAPTLKKLSERFNNQCIFWLGSMPRGANFYDGSKHKFKPTQMRMQFFKAHLETFPAWQGNLHQTYANYTGCPFLCCYYLEELWKDVYRHFDPLIHQKGVDLRATLGDRLLGRSVKWPKSNPGPTPYDYSWFWFNTRKFYEKSVRGVAA